MAPSEARRPGSVADAVSGSVGRDTNDADLKPLRAIFMDCRNCDRLSCAVEDKGKATAVVEGEVTVVVMFKRNLLEANTRQEGKTEESDE